MENTRELVLKMAEIIDQKGAGPVDVRSSAAF
jgi:hypothetical protein